MRRDDKLGSVLHQVVHVLHQADDAPGRQGRLRLIQDIQSLSAEPVLHQGKEAFPVGLPVQGDPAVAVDNRRAQAAFPVHLVDVGGHVIKAFRPQEEPVPGAESSVEKLKFLVPPSGLNPWEMARASIRVDFPDPFSPTKKVTCLWNSIPLSDRCFTTGRLAR